MSSFSVGGLNTGIDYNKLISKMIEAKRAPIDILEEKKSSYTDKISSYDELSAHLTELKSSAKNLKSTSSFFVKTASVSDSTVVDATAAGTASTGNYSLVVSNLASEAKEVHNGTGLTSSSDAVNSSGSDKVFQYTYAGTQTSVTVADGTSLDALKNLINDDASNPGVSATVVSDGTNYRLILTGDDTGATNTVTIDAGTTLDGTGSTVDFSSSSFSETKTAADASFTVDGLSITRSSNSFSDVIEGVTLNLKKASSATITVAADTDSIKEQIEEFVSAYNNVFSFLTTNTAYDTTTNEGAILSGEGTARNIQNKMRDMISDTVSGLSGSLSLLAEIGITTDFETGNLEINSSTLDTKLGSSLNDLADLFKDSTNGIATQVYDYITDISSTVDGSIKLRKDGLQDIIDNITTSIDSMEYRLSRTESDLTRQFTSLEKMVGNYNSVSTYLSGFSTRA